MTPEAMERKFQRQMENVRTARVQSRSVLDDFECHEPYCDCRNEMVAIGCDQHHRGVFVYYQKARGIVVVICPECDVVLGAYRLAGDA
jgi:hypothetical protein